MSTKTKNQRKKPAPVGECRVIDTSLLVDDPGAVVELAKYSDVRLPIAVLSDLGRLKTHQYKSFQVRHAANEALDELTKILGNHPRFNGGIDIMETGHKLHVDGVNRKSQVFLEHPDGKTTGTQVLASCIQLKQTYVKVILVTKDKALRLQAASMDIDTEYYEREFTPCYQGDELVSAQPKIELLTPQQKIANRFFILNNSKDTLWVLRKKDEHSDLGIDQINFNKQGAFGIKPRTVEQAGALWALLSDDIKFVSLQGEAGTGKTFLAILAGIFGVMAGKYKKIIITRAMTPVEGQGIGFLPGDSAQKISPYMGGVYDNIDSIKSNALKEKYFASTRSKDYAAFDKLCAEKIEAIPFDLMRGRSLENTFLIIDEAQNTTTHAMKMLLTRLCHTSKVAVMGDNKQIDDPYLDDRSNGMAKAIKTFVDFYGAAHIKLPENERGPLSLRASQIY